MTQRRIGVAVSGRDSGAILAEIQKLEEFGVPAAWLTTAGAGAGGLEALTLFAAAASTTRSIMLGSSITLTFPAHPLIVVEQARVVGQLAPGRFRLGVGPGSPFSIEKSFGIDYRAPLGHLREYLRIARALLHDGVVDFDGRYYRVHAEVGLPVDVPVMASAEGVKAYELCGAEADGAISWLCPGLYLRDLAVPAMKVAAERAGRSMPPLVAHAPICLHDNLDEVRTAFLRQFSYMMSSKNFAGVFTAAGFPEINQGICSNAMVDAVVLWGSESRVADRLMEMFSFGATEVVVSPLPVGEDETDSVDRIFRLLAQVAAGAESNPGH